GREAQVTNQWRHHRVQARLVDRLARDLGHEALEELLLEALREVLAHQIERHPPGAKARQVRAPLDPARRSVEPSLYLFGRHLDLERVLPGSAGTGGRLHDSPVTPQ